MRLLHRWTMTIAALFLVYVATTGILIQLIDLKTLYAHAPAADLNMRAIRDGIYGPPGFEVISVADYGASTLPPNFDAAKMLATVQAAARARIPAEPFNWVELRMDGATPVGVVAFAGSAPRQLSFNALTGAALGSADNAPAFGTPAGAQPAHDLVKSWHRGNAFGNVGLWINLLVGIALLLMIISGLKIYFDLLGARQKSGRNQWFWS
jgi:hypothetical protein